MRKPQSRGAGTVRNGRLPVATGRRAMTKRRIKLALGLAILAALFLAIHYPSTLIGWWRGEAKYKGRYTNSWRAELRAYAVIPGPSSIVPLRPWVLWRRPTQWERWLNK